MGRFFARDVFGHPKVFGQPKRTMERHSLEADGCNLISPPGSSRGRYAAMLPTTAIGMNCSARLKKFSFGGLLVLGCVVVYHLVASLPAVPRVSAATGVGRLSEDKSLCGSVMEDAEYHSKESLRRISQIFSLDACCAACAADSECSAWSYGKKEGVSGLTHACYLKKLQEGESPSVVRRPGVVSGLVKYRTEKHGIGKDDAGLVSTLVDENTMSLRNPSVHSNETCRGHVDLLGHGQVQIMNARWLRPGLAAKVVGVRSKHHSKHSSSNRSSSSNTSGWAVAPSLGSRAFFAERCSTSKQIAQDLSGLQLLGRTIRYTTDLSSLGCGCNAQFHLLPMRLSRKSKCDDYFCAPGKNSVCGETCASVRLQDANRYAWMTALQLEDDEKGVSVGYGGGLGWTGRRNWTSHQYGPGADCIDTLWPFQVAVSFPVDGRGILEAVDIVLSQTDRHSCQLTSRIDTYSFGGRNGLEELSSLLDPGLTPVVSYWSSPHMGWLDGLGNDGKGPCVQDHPEACGGAPVFYGMEIHWSQRATSVSPPVFGGALLAVHEKLQGNNAKEIVPKKNCVGPCEVNFAPKQIEQVLGAKKNVGAAQTGDSDMEEVSTGNVEWEITDGPVPVRRSANSGAKVLQQKRKGQVVVGDVTNEWIHLLRQPGWVALRRGPNSAAVLKQRMVDYKKLGRMGPCEEAGMFTIEDQQVCESAAFALGYLDSFVNTFSAPSSRPYGCYLVRGQLFFVSNPKNKKNPVVGERRCICANIRYPRVQQSA